MLNWYFAHRKREALDVAGAPPEFSGSGHALHNAKRLREFVLPCDERGEAWAKAMILLTGQFKPRLTRISNKRNWLSSATEIGAG